jgi:hypothetical protein
LDALTPAELERRIRLAIESRLDMAMWERQQCNEAAERESLRVVSGNWGLVLDTVQAVAGGAR